MPLNLGGIQYRELSMIWRAGENSDKKTNLADAICQHFAIDNTMSDAISEVTSLVEMISKYFQRILIIKTTKLSLYLSYINPVLTVIITS